MLLTQPGQQPLDPRRRLWLARASRTVAGAAALAASGARAASTVAADAPEPAPRASRGYRETDRVRRYYDLARF